MAKKKSRKYKKPSFSKEPDSVKMEETEKKEEFEEAAIVKEPVEIEEPAEETAEEKPAEEEKPEEEKPKIYTPPIKKRAPAVKYRKVVYVGTADHSTTIGAVTGKKYSFYKDKYGMPKPTNVSEKDYLGIIALKGKGCSRRDPEALFITKQDWDLEISEAGRVNR